MSAFLYIKDMRKQSSFRYNRILSKKSKFFVSKYNRDFHYFADGTLIHHCCVKDGIFNVNDHKKLQRIYNLLKINNMPIVREYCPSTQLDYFKYRELLRFISEQALINYSYKTDLYIEELPDLDVFIQECFDNNNILLTASKYEILPSDLRSDLAIFAGGKVFVSENCKKELNSIFNNKELHFLSVSDECINQLYERLPEFQKSAATIYIEILKQKARKLKRLTGEQHSKMLDLVAKEAGWKNWQSVKIESEKHARLLIDEEKQRSIK